MFQINFGSFYHAHMYIKSTFLLTQAATGYIRSKDNLEIDENVVGRRVIGGGGGGSGNGDGGGDRGMRKLKMSHGMRSVVNELSCGNYDQAMALINKGLNCTNCQQDEILGLMEMKNIVARLRLQCDMPDEMFGPTMKTNALPHRFSIEMLDVVQKVLRCRSHYEVLRISQHATFSEVKRAYKRLALRLHPDKNRAPGAEEAFRCINEAADTLTDSQKRIEYNMMKAVGEHVDTKGYFKGEYAENEAKAQAEQMERAEDEEFAQLRRPSYQPANQRVPQRQSLYQTEQLVIGLVASLVFIIITLHYLATAPNFSFTPTRTHSVRLMSRNNRVPYFVTPELAASYTPQQLQRLDQEIEEIYLTDLKYNCKEERKLRDKLLQRARNINNRSLRDHALRMPTPACRALDSFEAARYKPMIVNNMENS